MKTTLLTFASAALLSAAVLAGGGAKTADQHMSPGESAQQPSQQQSFNQHDKDQDGKISKAEAAGNMHLTERWVEIDANQDGSVDVTEFSKFEPVAQTQDSDSDAQQPSEELDLPSENPFEQGGMEDDGDSQGSDQ